MCDQESFGMTPAAQVSPAPTTDTRGSDVARRHNYARQLGVALAASLLVGVGGAEGLEFSPPFPLNSNAAHDSGWDAAPHIASAGNGTAVAVWESASSLGGSIGSDLDILFARSTDGGATWTAPATLNRNAASDSGSDSVPRIATDGGGTWVAVWESTEDVAGSGANDPEVLVARSTDDGRTWSEPALLNSDGDPMWSDRTPSIRTDQRGTWIVAWTSSGFAQDGRLLSRVVVARSLDHGQSWFEAVVADGAAPVSARRHLDPQIDTDGSGTWAVIWSAQAQANSDWDVQLVVSADGGQRWSPPTLVTDDESANDLAPRIALHRDDTWVAVWQSSGSRGSSSGTDSDILAAWSEDGGMTWGPPAAIDARAATDAVADIEPSIAIDRDGTCFVSWINWDGASSRLTFSRSDDGGRTWSAAAPVDGDASVTDSDEDVELHLSSDGVLLAVWRAVNWRGDSLGTDRDILYARSSDGGATWSERRPLNQNALGDEDWDRNATVAGSSDGTWVVLWNSPTAWADGTGWDWDIAVSRSTDNGETWSEQAWVSQNALSQAVVDRGSDWAPAVATDRSGTWVAVWSCQMWNGAFWDWDICSARSVDRGASWSPPGRVSSLAAGPATAETDERPRIAASGTGTWLITWQARPATGGSDSELRVARSTDGGATWSVPARLDPQFAGGGADRWPDLAADQDGVWVVAWESTRSLGALGADTDVLFARSMDDGVTWTAPAALVADATRDAGSDERVSLATDGKNNWLAVWQSTDAAISRGADVDLAAAHSADGGSTWSAAVAVDPTPEQNVAVDWAPRVASNGSGDWTVVWEARGLPGKVGQPTIAVSQSSDGGRTWTMPAPLIPGGRPLGNQASPALASDSHDVWLVAFEGQDFLDPRIGRDYDLLVSRGAPDGRFPTPTPTLTATRRPTSRVTPTPRRTNECAGDCNGDGQVTVNELIIGVAINLGSERLDRCGSLDVNGDGLIAVNELIGGANRALCGCAGCPMPPPPTPTATRTPTPTSPPPTATATVDIPTAEIEAACDQNCRLARSCDPEEFDIQEGSIEDCIELCASDFEDESLSCIDGTLDYFRCVNRLRRCGLPTACDGAFVRAASSCPDQQFPAPISVFY